jgi:beta-carotene hydroxylase
MTLPDFKINKYQFNQIVLFFSIATIISVFSYLIQHKGIVFWPIYILFFILVSFAQHYILNIVHLASHQLLSKDRKLNYYLGSLASLEGGVTFADFSTTHMLHHKNTSKLDSDPDHWITNSGSIFSIPFKIFYHDVYFWTRGLWKLQRGWLNYILTRSIQIGIVVAFELTGNIDIWKNFWLSPLLVVGFLNGLFLFYYPHYSTKLENSWRILQKPNFVQKLFLLFIDISRVYHEKHHDKIVENSHYYPVFSYIKDEVIGDWKPNIKNYKSKYTDIQTQQG